MRHGVAGLLLVLLSGCGDEPGGGRMNPGAETATGRITGDRVMLIAHRGASARMPENTIPAFQEARAAFVDLVELDYRHSKDGVPVVIHDKTFDRTTDALKRWGSKDIGVHTRTLEEIRTLDAGAWFNPRYRGTRIPTLEEAVGIIELEALPLIERKAGDAKTLVDWLKETGRVRGVVVQAFDWDFLAACRKLAPDLALGALGKEGVTDGDLARIRSFGAVVAGWRAKDLDESIVTRFHDAGLKVWAYTVNDPAQARWLVARGVDGIITDVPVEIGKLLD